MKKKSDQGTAPVKITAPAVAKAGLNPTFGPFIPICSNHGISRSVAYKLLAAGRLNTFMIGRRRYILVSSLRELPLKLQVAAAAK